MVHQQHLKQFALLWTLFWNNGQDADKSQKRKFLILDQNYNLLIHDYFSSPLSAKIDIERKLSITSFLFKQTLLFHFCIVTCLFIFFFGHNLTTSHIFLRSCQNFFSNLEKYMEHAWNIFENLITQIKELKNLFERDLSCVSLIRGWQVYHVNENVKMEINRLYIFA